MDIVALGQVERFRSGIEDRGMELCEADAHRIILLSFLATGETIRDGLSSDVDEMLGDAYARIDRAKSQLLVN